jgi:hypothetical protein
MTHEVRKIGLDAEERVLELARSLGDARKATKEEDHGKKIDLFLENRPIQVSVQPKSNKVREKLQRKGITPIPAGAPYSDAFILEQLRQLIDKNE